MPDLPTGTVTFLFTDIEDSTALGEQHPETMRHALIRHDALVEQIVAEHGGHVVRPRGEGDSRFAVFTRATDAVAAAAALQQTLYIEPWPTPTPLRVRMALHTGEADLRDGDYYGSAVNRCARLRTAAHGGQTVLSQATYDLVRDHLLPGGELRDLGEHRLKDLQRSEHVFQLVMADLQAEFPPLNTLDAVAHNLPLQPTSFIGRAAEVAAICQRLLDPTVRLLTLTGPGGSGKTRLALQVAAEVLDQFADGVWLAELAPTHDPTLVSSAIATALGVKESGAQPLRESLKTYLRDMHLLLVLDNFEQVLAAAPLVAEVLRAAPGLKVLVTSRARLQLRGEREVAVPPLSLPLLTALPDPTALEQVAAVRLFVERARDARADFLLTTANAAAVAEICVRLDGLPLAIELAAARSKMLAPQALLSRLQNRLKLLTGGAHDLPTRQQTLRGTIEWSFSLLDASEQRLFTRLGVFVGGWTVEAAEAVCNGDGNLGIDVLDGLQSLLDKSLLKQRETTDGEPRFRRLETIREYAVERLAASSEATLLRERHAQYLLAKIAWPRFSLDELQFPWLRAELDNLRAALGWSLSGGNAEVGVRLASALWRFWLIISDCSEGRAWLDQALAQDSGVSDWARAVARTRAGDLARRQGALMDDAQAYVEAALPLLQRLDDPWERAFASLVLGNVAISRRDWQLAMVHAQQALAGFREVGDLEWTGWTLWDMARVARQQHELQKAIAFAEEAGMLFERVGSKAAMALALMARGEAATDQGDYARAAHCYTTMQEIGRELDVSYFDADVLCRLAIVAQRRGDRVEAGRLYRECLARYRRTWEDSLAACMDGLAVLASEPGGTNAQGRHAARLFGAAEALRTVFGTEFLVVDAADYQPQVAEVRAQLDDATFAAAWAEGQAMTLGQAVAYALEEGMDA